MMMITESRRRGKWTDLTFLLISLNLEMFIACITMLTLQNQQVVHHHSPSCCAPSPPRNFFLDRNVVAVDNIGDEKEKYIFLFKLQSYHETLLVNVGEWNECEEKWSKCCCKGRFQRNESKWRHPHHHHLRMKVYYYVKCLNIIIRSIPTHVTATVRKLCVPIWIWPLCVCVCTREKREKERECVCE